MPVTNSDERIHELEAQLSQLKPRAVFGDQCYQDRCENAYVEQSVLNRVERQLATARKLIPWLSYLDGHGFTESEYATVREIQNEADQFMKETEGR